MKSFDEPSSASRGDIPIHTGQTVDKTDVRSLYTPIVRRQRLSRLIFTQ